MIEAHRISEDNLFSVDFEMSEQNWGAFGAHDPAIIKDKDWYYAFSTDTGSRDNFKAGIQIRKSQDLINWEWVGHAFENGVPQEAYNWTGAKGMWAPEIVKMNDQYFLYYSASQFGKTQSFIGVATSSHIEGPYQDQGVVYKSRQGEDEEPNAIDPNMIFDRNKQPWIVYGSFFGGIHINKVDPQTGKFIEKGKGTLIAKRNRTVDRAIEGPYIVYNPDTDYYYLFVSYDSLFADYNIRVARSKNITGPYYDYNGLKMTDLDSPQKEIGMKVLGGYKFKDHSGWIGPGHNSILKDGSDYYVCHHIRAAENRHAHFLQIRKIFWSDEGWPLVSPQRFSGESDRKVKENELIGNWEFFEVDPYNDHQDESFEIVVTETKGEAYFNKKAIDNSFTLNLNGKEIDGKVNESWDWERWLTTVVFTGHDENGLVTLGKKVIDK